jgi:hypothetical protein
LDGAATLQNHISLYITSEEINQGYETITVVLLKTPVFWDVMLCCWTGSLYVSKL